MKVRVTKKPPIETKHGVEVGNVYEVLADGRENRTHKKGPHKGQQARSEFVGSVWVAGATGERVRLLANEWVKEAP